jgi:hypothetical protein
VFFVRARRKSAELAAFIKINLENLAIFCPIGKNFAIF